MKKLLCVLMFGMVFGQNLTSKMISIPYDNETKYDMIANYIDQNFTYGSIAMEVVNIYGVISITMVN